MEGKMIGDEEEEEGRGTKAGFKFNDVSGGKHIRVRLVELLWYRRSLLESPEFDSGRKRGSGANQCPRVPRGCGARVDWSCNFCPHALFYFLSIPFLPFFVTLELSDNSQPYIFFL